MSKARELLELVEQMGGSGQGVGNPRVGDGGTDVCVCPNCGYEEPHEKGVPCNQKKCPKCGTPMVGKRENSEGGEE